MSTAGNERQAPAKHDSVFNTAFAACRFSAIHWELRDQYTPQDPNFLGWVAGKRFDPAERYSSWRSKVTAAVARGVSIRRLRVVSEPVTGYIRFEYDITTGLNIAAGEDVRWLPRQRAADLLVPGCDGWVFDGEVVVFNHFAGDGSWIGEERLDVPAVAARHLEAFDQLWDRAVPHADFKV